MTVYGLDSRGSSADSRVVAALCTPAAAQELFHDKCKGRSAGTNEAAIGLQHRVEFASRQGTAEQVALGLIAAQRAQHLHLLGQLYALCRGQHAQAGTQCSDGAHDCRGLRIVDHVADERAVDLDFLEWKRAKIA